jgi:hypothetical protein
MTLSRTIKLQHPLLERVESGRQWRGPEDGAVLDQYASGTQEPDVFLHIVLMQALHEQRQRLWDFTRLLAALYPQSPFDSHQENPILHFIWQDKWTERYLAHVKKHQTDGWHRGESKAAKGKQLLVNRKPAQAHSGKAAKMRGVCPEMEGYLVDAVQDHHALLIIPGENDPPTLWLHKSPVTGAIGIDKTYGEISVLVNLATGEVYLPGTELRKWLDKASQPVHETVTEISMEQLRQAIGPENMRLHFSRSVHPGSTGYQELKRIREELLNNNFRPQLT